MYTSKCLWIWLVVSILNTVQACFEYTHPNANPCIKKACQAGSQCVPSLDGRNAECVCPVKCHSFGDSRDSRPVCGSDGHDYANLCELNRQACALNRTVTVRYEGSCDPCYGVKCPESQICQIDDNRNPICKCNAACGQEFEPVCGSDGKTYINECILRVEACKTRKSLRILHQGLCSESNSCRALKCLTYQECEVNSYGVAVCQCPTTCSKVLRPVCGTDGETYDSECELKRHACIGHRNISVRYLGICDPANYCHQNHGVCKYGAVCLAIGHTQYNCVCPECSEDYAPVCGSNGITYTNLCKFRHHMCERKLSNVTVHEGTCAGCEKINCPFYAYCENGQCSCSARCDTNHQPVCGSDLITYGNECELRLNSCRHGKYIVPLKRGACSSCQGVHCDYGARCENGVCVCPRKCPSDIELVCGSNNVTYDNECRLMSASCQSTSKISLQSKGPCEIRSSLQSKSENLMEQLCELNTCKYEGICVRDKDKNQCLCDFQCYKTDDTNTRICGNDGRVYANECFFHQEMCLRQQEIKRMETRYCEAYRNIPCEGEPPLTSQLTGEEFNCSTESCPADSYCHRGIDFAKCCPEIEIDEDCKDTAFGCCPDEKTPALGVQHRGCPSTCRCNRLGSYLLKCDPKTQQCYCKPGVGGLRCDRCEAGYWGLHKISEGNAGCIACACNQIGSSRNDCEQMSGRCVCKTGYYGMKCDICPDGSSVEQFGCARVDNITCLDNRQCKFGSTCKDYLCTCDAIDCSLVEKMPVCGDDGNLHDSECHLKLWSCKLQKTITNVNIEKCRSSTKHSATTSPVRRSTEYQNYKSTLKVDLDNENSANTGPTMPTLLHWDKLSEESIFFDGNAYIEMNTLQAYSKVEVKIELVSFEPEGVIFFNAQTNNIEGDYIALLLKNAHIELRYNLGSGSVILRSAQPITMGKTVTIQLWRRLSEASLSVESQENITGRSEGPHKLLDLGQNFFLGGTFYGNIKKFYEILGIKTNFTGCIRKLYINEELVALNDSTQKNIIHRNGVANCTHATCSQYYCHNSGICQQESDRLYSCQCHVNYTGSRCQLSSWQHNAHNTRWSNNNFPLDFWNNSYIQLPTLQGVSQAFVIEFWLMPRSPNGLILYNGQSKGDFVMLALVDAHVHFSFNLGGQGNKSGIVLIKSHSPLNLGEWHRVVIARKIKEGMLQVNDMPPINDTAKGNLNELNLDEPLYLGGYYDKQKWPTHFNGAIQRIALNGQLWRDVLNRSIEVVNIQPYQGPPCGYENPCHNHGECFAWLHNFICRCSKNFHGPKCEQTLETSIKPTISQDGAYIEYTSAIQQQNFIELKLRTTKLDGLLLWLSNDSLHISDYLVLALVDGYLEFSFDLGKQTRFIAIRSSVRVNDGETHQVVVMRNKQLGILQLDDKWLSSQLSEPGATVLNNNGQLWIGGNDRLPSGLPNAYYHTFSGCLLSFKVEGIAVDLSIIRSEQLNCS